MEERQKELIYAWVFGSKSLNILIFGKIGTGKSSLINSLLKEQVAEEGAGIYAVTKEVESYTRTIRPIETIINDVRVTLWDTPGLRDPFTDEKKTLEAIAEVRHKVDLFLFCIRMDQTRLNKDDVKAIQGLTEALGENIWSRAIFALTFANITHPPIGESSTDYLKLRETQWQQALRNVIKMSTKDISDTTIPIIPTGYKEQLLPDGRNWFTPFWEACLSRVRYDSIPAFLRVNKDEWFNPEVRHQIASRVISQRLKEIGDGIEDDGTNPEQLSRRMDPVQMLNVVAEAILTDEQSVLSQFCRRLGYAFKLRGIPILVAASAVVFAAVFVKSS